MVPRPPQWLRLLKATASRFYTQCVHVEALCE